MAPMSLKSLLLRLARYKVQSPNSKIGGEKGSGYARLTRMYMDIEKKGKWSEMQECFDQENFGSSKEDIYQMKLLVKSLEINHIEYGVQYI